MQIPGRGLQAQVNAQKEHLPRDVKQQHLLGQRTVPHLPCARQVISIWKTQQPQPGICEPSGSEDVESSTWRGVGRAPAKSLQSCPTLCDPVDCSPPGSSVHRSLQTRILEWVAISSFRGSSQPRN